MGETTPIPTVETATTAAQAGRPFKPEGRGVVPEDCVQVFLYDAQNAMVVTADNIKKVFQDENDLENARGEQARRAYLDYVKALFIDPNNSQRNQLLEDANLKFHAITNFGLREVIEFENKVRIHFHLDVLPS